MVSIQTCRRYLHTTPRLSNAEIKRLRDFLYALATLEYEAAK